MATLDVYTTERKKSGSVDIPEILTNVEANDGLIFDAVHATLTNQRQGTVKTKTRSEVSGGGRKPFKQKGTGRARQGSIRASIYVGGGVSFGPRQRNWEIQLPKKQKRRALKLALANKIEGDKVLIVDDWNCEKPSTKTLISQLDALQVNRALLVVSDAEPALLKSARNIPGVNVVESQFVHTAQLLQHDHIVMTKEAFTQVGQRLL